MAEQTQSAGPSQEASPASQASVPELSESAPAASPPSPPAGPPKVAIGFSRLLVRLGVTDQIGLAREEFRVHILEEMRQMGFNAVGAENLVFDKDRSDAADVVLGGTVRELRCIHKRATLNCGLGIDWELLDRRTDSIVYRVRTRARVLGLSPKAEDNGRALVLASLRSLLRRPRFRAVLRSRAVEPAAANTLEFEGYQTCDVEDRPMPSEAAKALEGTVVVYSGNAMGSAFFISPSGLLLTAAHVMASPRAQVRLRDGTKRTVRLLRTAPKVDAALLYVPGLKQSPCLGLSKPPHALGSEVYAIGTPASDELAFSLTRGIISGQRVIDGGDLLQTDASVNPGNSGGPLIDAQGRALAIVSWKVAGHDVEGLAFGVPVETALAALRVVPAAETSQRLLSQSGPAPREEVGTVTDVSDPPPSLDPERDRLEEERRERERRDERLWAITPWYVPAMRWGGLALVGVGALGIATTVLSFDKYETTRSEFESLRAWNDWSWVAATMGAAGFIASFPLAPSLPTDSEQVEKPKPPKPKPGANDTWGSSRVFGPGVHVRVEF
jgi:serine protease Do